LGGLVEGGGALAGFAADLEVDGDFVEGEQFAEAVHDEALVGLADELGVVHEQENGGGGNVGLGDVVDLGALAARGAGHALVHDLLHDVVEL